MRVELVILVVQNELENCEIFDNFNLFEREKKCIIRDNKLPDDRHIAIRRKKMTTGQTAVPINFHPFIKKFIKVIKQTNSKVIINNYNNKSFIYTHV